MSDTVIFGRTIKGSFLGCVLYVGIDFCRTFGQAFLTMKAEDWAAMWWMNKTGWWLLQIGGLFILVKAYYSKSSKAL